MSGRSVLLPSRPSLPSLSVPAALQDTHAWGRPLLVNMADPQLCFSQGLSRFKKLALMSSIRDDRMVVSAGWSMQHCGKLLTQLLAGSLFVHDPSLPPQCVPFDVPLCLKLMHLMHHRSQLAMLMAYL